MITPHRFHQWILNRLLKWDQDDIFPTNYRLNTTQEINRMMMKAGFSCVELKLVNHYPAYLMFSPLLFRIGIAFDELIREHDILKQLRGSIVGTFEKKLTWLFCYFFKRIRANTCVSTCEKQTA